jgi:hypothetical protein
MNLLTYLIYDLDNNYCGLTSYGQANAWNFADWDNWAKNTSPNKNVKVYIGAPASSTAANSGYVNANTLVTIAKATKATYSSFGGVMFWDASQAYGRYCSSLEVDVKLIVPYSQRPHRGSS